MITLFLFISCSRIYQNHKDCTTLYNLRLIDFKITDIYTHDNDAHLYQLNLYI